MSLIIVDSIFSGFEPTSPKEERHRARYFSWPSVGYNERLLNSEESGSCLKSSLNWMPMICTKFSAEKNASVIVFAAIALRVQSYPDEGWDFNNWHIHG